MLRVKSIFVLCLLIIVGTLLSGCQSHPTHADATQVNGVQAMTIKISHVVAENTPKHKGALKMKEVIEEQSNGKIRVEIFPNSSLFGDKDEYQNLIANNVQFIMPEMTKLVGSEVGFNIPGMPFLFENDEAAENFWDGPKGKEVLARLQKDKVLGLTMWPNGAKHVTNNNHTISSPSDFAGLKVRTTGGQLLEELYKSLGAGSSSIPFGELYTALQQGTVDGQDNPYSNIESKKFAEVQEYLTIIGMNRVDYALLTNTTFWDGLNDESKRIVQAGIDAGTEIARDSAEKLNDEAYVKIQNESDIEINELTDEEIEAFKEHLQPVYDKWKEIIGEDIIEDAEKR
ncbi:DctP family TRAP transporter solute-binding subunit [Cytobacillus sp. FSL W7-1323]|uniref:DctP family TRAP transporter solute-binding subunit n=1 Tax=Cytobacillus sp. FSL W7-1323 TaxID=2921700 RepID=UPI0031595419